MPAKMDPLTELIGQSSAIVAVRGKIGRLRNFGITETDQPEAITGKVRASLQQVEMESEE